MEPSSSNDTTTTLPMDSTADASSLQHPKSPFKSSDEISQQYALLVEAMAKSVINQNITVDNFQAFIIEIIGSKQDNILFADHIGEVFELTSIKSAFEFCTRFSSSIDIELLVLIIENYSLRQCSTLLATYKEKLMKSKYSEHIVAKLSPGEKFVSCIFRDMNDPDPTCEDIINKKSFCLAFGIQPIALQLVECCKLSEGVRLKWQVFTNIVEIFKEELTDDSLKKIAPLNLKSLQVETTKLYFYCMPNVTQEPSDKVSIQLCTDAK